MKEFRSVIKNSKFVYLWTSQVLSQLTINMLSFLVLIDIYEKTQSTIATSMLWMAYTIPALIVGPFAAALVDWTDKRKTLMVSNLLQAIIILGYVFLSSKKIVFISYGVVFLYSLLNQFYVPAEAATLPIVVKKKKLPQANGLFFITQQASLVVGFGLAGILSSFLGFKTSVFIASICLFIAFISVSFLPEMKSRKTKISDDLEKEIGKFFQDLLEGYRFIKDNKNILMPFVLLIVLQVMLSVIVVGLPILATDIVKVPAAQSGLVIIAPAGIGAVLSTVSVSKLLARGTRKKAIIERSLETMGILFLSALAIPYLIGWARIIVSIIVFFITGTCFVGVLVPSLTFLQEKTPGGLMGRVFGNFWFLTTVATILPVFFSATITEVLGVTALLVLLSLTAFGMVAISKYFPRRFQNAI